VKIRGHRVELGEIEAYLLEHPAVSAAAVAVHPDRHAHPELVGYLVQRVGAPRPAPDELRAVLRRNLPAAAVPTAWVVLDRLPTTPNGKLDRAALPPPAPPGLAASPGFAAQQSAASDRRPTATMARLLPMWRDALRLSDVAVDDDLFNLGGHSLTVIQLVDRISTELGVEVALEAFYERPTVAEIADLIDRMAVAR